MRLLGLPKERCTKNAPAGSRRFLVVSDGVDVQSKRSLDEVISMAHTAETAIHTQAPLGLPEAGDKLLRVMAEQTGGAACFPSKNTRRRPGHRVSVAQADWDGLRRTKVSGPRPVPTRRNVCTTGGCPGQSINRRAIQH
jgi:hypothetical protein